MHERFSWVCSQQNSSFWYFENISVIIAKYGCWGAKVCKLIWHFLGFQISCLYIIQGFAFFASAGYRMHGLLWEFQGFDKSSDYSSVFKAATGTNLFLLADLFGNDTQYCLQKCLPQPELLLQIPAYFWGSFNFLTGSLKWLSHANTPVSDLAKTIFA